LPPSRNCSKCGKELKNDDKARLKVWGKFVCKSCSNSSERRRYFQGPKNGVPIAPQSLGYPGYWYVRPEPQVMDGTTVTQMRSKTEARALGVPLFGLAIFLAILGSLIIPTTLPTSSNLYWFRVLTWSSESLEDLSMGFAALAVFLILLSFVAADLRRFDVGFHLNRVVRMASLVCALSAIGVFLTLAIADDISIGGMNLDLIGPLVLRDLYVAHVIDLNHVQGIFNINVIGWNATVAVSTAILFMFVYRVNQGILTAIWKAITLFASPAVMAFEIGLLLFGPSTMTLQVTNYLIGSPLASILTNWFLLVVSAGLFMLGLTTRKEWIE